MRGRPWFLGAALAALAAPAARAAPPPPAQPSPPAGSAQPAPAAQPAVDPKADEQLRKMSDYLTGLKSFSFSTSSVDEAVTTEGQKLAFLAAQNVSVRRPDKLRTDKVGPERDTSFRYDGKSFSVYGNKTGYYAEAPAPGQLDAAIDDARQRFHIDAPGADLLNSNVYATLMDGVSSGRYVGLETLEGVPCHHLAFRGQDVDWQIWIQDGAEPLPRRYQITTKNVNGQPEFAVNISNWQTRAQLPDDLFVLRPPPGSKKIDLQPAAPVPSP